MYKILDRKLYKGIFKMNIFHKNQHNHRRCSKCERKTEHCSKCWRCKYGDIVREVSFELLIIFFGILYLVIFSV